MLQETAKRLGGPTFGPPLVVCNDEHRFIVAEQLRDAGIETQAIVLEPQQRNTAPAAALAALILERRDPETVMLLAPSDHVIANQEAFLSAVRTGAEAARAGRLVTFGITPDHSATSYGYIKKGKAIDGIEGCFAIERFTEKPNAETAAGFLSAEGYFWNSGIFVFSAALYIETLQRLRPDMVEACRKAVDNGRDDLDFFRPDGVAFGTCPVESIDFAVMEHANNGGIIPVDMGWRDIGSWAALWELGDKDDDGNVRIGDVVAKNVRDSYLRSDGPMIAAIGLKDVAIVATGDVVLVVSKDAVDSIKAVVEELKDAGRTEVLSHLRVYRPWGWYQTLDLGERFQVKHLMIKPGAGLSLQVHKHRAEHWVVVAGTAKVTRGDEIITLGEDESTYLPAGTKHRLENEGAEPLSVIEVQSGSYLGEDDIVRFDDRYGRD